MLLYKISVGTYNNGKNIFEICAPITLEDIQCLEKMDKTIDNIIDFVQSDVEILQADVNRLNYEKIRNNIIIHGIPVNKEEDPNHLVVTICNTIKKPKLECQLQESVFLAPSPHGL